LRRESPAHARRSRKSPAHLPLPTSRHVRQFFARRYEPPSFESPTTEPKTRPKRRPKPRQSEQTNISNHHTPSGTGPSQRERADRHSNNRAHQPHRAPSHQQRSPTTQPQPASAGGPNRCPWLRHHTTADASGQPPPAGTSRRLHHPEQGGARDPVPSQRLQSIAATASRPARARLNSRTWKPRGPAATAWQQPGQRSGRRHRLHAQVKYRGRPSGLYAKAVVQTENTERRRPGLYAAGVDGHSISVSFTEHFAPSSSPGISYRKGRRHQPCSRPISRSAPRQRLRPVPFRSVRRRLDHPRLEVRPSRRATHSALLTSHQAERPTQPPSSSIRGCVALGSSYFKGCRTSSRHTPAHITPIPRESRTAIIAARRSCLTPTAVFQYPWVRRARLLLLQRLSYLAAPHTHSHHTRPSSPSHPPQPVAHPRWRAPHSNAFVHSPPAAAPLRLERSYARAKECW